MQGPPWLLWCPGWGTLVPHPHCCPHHLLHHKHNIDSYHGYRVTDRTLSWLHPHHTSIAIHTTGHTTNTVLTVTMGTDEQSSVLAPSPPPTAVHTMCHTTQYWQLPWVQSDEQSSDLAPPPPHPHCYPHHLSHHKHILTVTMDTEWLTGLCHVGGGGGGAGGVPGSPTTYPTVAHTACHMAHTQLSKVMWGFNPKI